MTRKVSGIYDLHQVVYVSRATQEFYADQSECVANILRTAPDNNRRLEVTGALLACDNWFVQVLEGLRINVDKTLERIARDSNHTGIRRLVSGPIDERRFGQWSMCAKTLSPTDAAIVRALESSRRFDARSLTRDTAVKLLLAVAQLQTASAAEA